jgi:hypothetical protein
MHKWCALCLKVIDHPGDGTRALLDCYHISWFTKVTTNHKCLSLWVYTCILAFHHCYWAARPTGGSAEWLVELWTNILAYLMSYSCELGFVHGVSHILKDTYVYTGIHSMETVHGYFIIVSQNEIANVYHALPLCSECEGLGRYWGCHTWYFEWKGPIYLAPFHNFLSCTAHDFLPFSYPSAYRWYMYMAGWPLCWSFVPSAKEFAC